MSHNISVSGGVAEVFTAGEPAWHRLGANVAKAQTWEEACRLAHLDWTISKRQLTNPATGEVIPSYALLRDDTNAWLSTVGAEYTPIQNTEAFSFVDGLIGEHGAHYVTAGALGRGDRMWVLAQLPATIEPVKGDKSLPYLLFTDPRGGGSAIARLVMTRVVCANTLAIALGEEQIGKAMLRLRHTGGVKDKLAAAKALMTGTVKSIKDIEALFVRLAEKRVDPPTLAKILTQLFPDLAESANQQNKARDILVNFQSNDGGAVKGIEGTAWALLNACTRWADHQRTGFQGTAGNPDALAAKRAESAMFGTGDAFKQQALDAILFAVGMAEVMTLGADGRPLSASKTDSILAQVSI
jgi:phage/plasmid-like protein (TIGR03299 family)